MDREGAAWEPKRDRVRYEDAISGPELARVGGRQDRRRAADPILHGKGSKRYAPGLIISNISPISA
jgi:hypothetical protein